jgi:hypothetical protein
MGKNRSRATRERQEHYRRNPEPVAVRTEHGFTPGRCDRCGHGTWLARLSPESQAEAGYRSRAVLDPVYVPGEGGTVLVSYGDVRFARLGQGSFRIHRCSGVVTVCKYCDGAIRIIGQIPGSRIAIAVVDADPDPRGNVVVNPDGFAVNDPGRAIEGTRYRWHARH